MRGRRTVTLFGVAALLACAGGPCEPATGGFSVSGDVLQIPLYNAEFGSLAQQLHPEPCPGHPEGALRVVGEQLASGKVGVTLVQANPPEVGVCAAGFEIVIFGYGTAGAAPPVGARVETILAWPESGDAWALTEPLAPPPPWYDGCSRAVEKVLMPEGHL